MNAAAREIQILFDVGSLGGLSDGQLLARFVEKREQAVCEAIVRRHGPMVWGVCRRILRDHHDAEDAFQATFLVLARKAASIKIRESSATGSWRGAPDGHEGEVGAGQEAGAGKSGAGDARAGGEE